MNSQFLKQLVKRSWICWNTIIGCFIFLSTKRLYIKKKLYSILFLSAFSLTFFMFTIKFCLFTLVFSFRYSLKFCCLCITLYLILAGVICILAASFIFLFNFSFTTFEALTRKQTNPILETQQTVEKSTD